MFITNEKIQKTIEVLKNPQDHRAYMGTIFMGMSSQYEEAINFAIYAVENVRECEECIGRLVCCSNCFEVYRQGDNFCSNCGKPTLK